MAEFSKFNGYDVKDATARSEIASLKSKVEGINGGVLSYNPDTDYFGTYHNGVWKDILFAGFVVDYIYHEGKGEEPTILQSVPSNVTYTYNSNADCFTVSVNYTATGANGVTYQYLNVPKKSRKTLKITYSSTGGNDNQYPTSIEATDGTKTVTASFSRNTNGERRTVELNLSTLANTFTINLKFICSDTSRNCTWKVYDVSFES